RAELKKIIKDYNNILNFSNSFNEDINKINVIINQLIKVTKIYREKLEKIRTKNNFYSFDDVPHLVLKLLVKDYNFDTSEIIKTDIAKNIANTFDEILIDEFQDTNLVQNLIFSSLSKDDTNLFIVGDVKQSIYGFRSARPDLLINEKNKAKTHQFPKLINLSKNFRSRSEILDFSNYLFSKIMSTDYGDIAYDENEVLNLGANYNEFSNNEAELYLLTELNDNDLEDEISNQEKEAILITNRIKELFNSNYQVFDSSTNKSRPLKQSDIAILLRSPGDFGNILRDTLINNGINVYTEKTPVYFNNYEVKLIIAILKIINNPYDEISLVSVLRSPLFGVEPGLLMEIRLHNKNNNLYNNLLKMRNNSLIDNFVNKLKDYQSKASRLKINKLLNYIYNDTKIMGIISSMDYPERRIKNILEMINHADNYLENNNNSLHDFIHYIDTLIDSDYSLEGVNPATDKDSVIITTIHKSKGLEFPVVILPRLDKRFNFDDLSKDILLDNDYYLGFKLRNHEKFGINSNLILELIKKEKRNKQLSEELRVLYVALTRAKEKLIMTGTIKNISKKINHINSLIGNDNVIPIIYLKQSKSMLDWIIPVVIKHQSSKELREIANIDTKLYNDTINLKTFVIDLNDIINDKNVLENTSETTINKEDIDNALNYVYPYEISNYKTKMSVSELNKQNHGVLKPSFIESNKQLEVGIVYHKVLEYLEFISYDFDSFKKEINNLINTDKLTSEEISLINLKKIFNFFNDRLYQDIIKNSENYKEYPITFTIKINEIDESSTLEDELVIDGIIDLFSKTDNNYYLIDYKSDVVQTEEELINRYKKQLDLYEYALKKRLNGNIHKYLYSFDLGKFIKL
ncbi:MAG: 3'-5' exonuclease, partial [Bacilli bacterium]|nr:3'-5' exonuclease [Bacilli bacterium]